MNRTREEFCRILLDDHPREALDPETLAAPLRALLRCASPSHDGADKGAAETGRVRRGVGQ